jgi:hypothetical protein
MGIHGKAGPDARKNLPCLLRSGVIGHNARYAVGWDPRPPKRLWNKNFVNQQVRPGRMTHQVLGHSGISGQDD